MSENSNPVPAEPVIRVEDIRKSFGLVRAVDGISFELKEGEFLTIFGPNGAGKTTLVKILSGLMRPTSGSARVAGFDVLNGDRRLRSRIGVISHASCLYADLTALENLVFYAKMYALDNPHDRAVRALEGVELKERMYDRVRTFSRGMQQRLTIARATIHDPPVLFLDEPFTGLDPHASNVLKEYLRSLHTAKRTIVMTTHDISCGIELCDWVAVQARGRFVFWETMDRVDKDGFEKTYFEAINE
ncbi:MAG: ABC transporter ATP-binding protein [Nitrospinaceae bacterium]